MSLPRRQMSLQFDESSADPEVWIDTLDAAFADPARTNGFLEPAEKAERACPGDPAILSLAATAALLDGRADKATLYLKRYAKRYFAGEPYHLLSALALAGQKNRIGARALLEQHRLTDWRYAMSAFPGGRARRRWLAESIDAIMGGKPEIRGRKPAGKAAPPPARSKIPPPPKPATPAPAPPQPPPAAPAIPALEQIRVDIPLVVESNLQPMLAAATDRAEAEGGWFALRERPPPPRLAGGFDEALGAARMR